MNLLQINGILSILRTSHFPCKVECTNYDPGSGSDYEITPAVETMTRLKLVAPDLTEDDLCVRTDWRSVYDSDCKLTKEGFEKVSKAIQGR